jgi:ribosome-associated protein
MYQTLRLAKKIAQAISFHKGEDVVVYNVEDLTPLARFYIVISAASERQINGFERECEEIITQAGGEIGHVEGRNGSEWVLIDAHDIVVHILSFEERERLHFDDLYARCPQVDYALKKPVKKGE